MPAIRTSAPTRIRQNIWSLDEVLPLDHQVAARYLAEVPEEVLTNFCHLLGRDVYSEGDAQSLYDYIQTRQTEMSPAFLAMLDLWLADELQHYEALRRTYHCIAGVSFGEMDRQFALRVHEITPIEMVMVDEFTLLVTLMFDELGSVYSYRRDLWEYYRHFDRAIHRIGHHLVQDEGMHFNNAAELLLAQHSDRLREVPQLLEQIAALEKRLQKYHKTFFLDHAQEQHRFPQNFNSVIIRSILWRLGLGEPPARSELQALWQWVPAECALVPVRLATQSLSICH